MNSKEKRYDDIIHLPHHRSEKRAPMPVCDRAAQFAPFAALTGYHDAVEETARLTETHTEPDEHAKEEINRRLQMLKEHISEAPTVSITYFIPDKRKDGGKYATVCGIVKKIKNFERRIVMADCREIPINEITQIEGSIFDPQL